MYEKLSIIDYSQTKTNHIFTAKTQYSSRDLKKPNNRAKTHKQSTQTESQENISHSPIVPKTNI